MGAIFAPVPNLGGADNDDESAALGFSFRRTCAATRSAVREDSLYGSALADADAASSRAAAM